MEFQAAYRSHYAEIRRLVRHLGIADRDTHDLTQEIFVIAFRKFEEFEGRSSLKAWLVGIAYRVVANRRRCAAARHEILGDTALSLTARHAEMETALEQRDLLRRLESVLDKLPEEQRVVFVLFELAELNGDEIAEALAIPVGTVRSRLRLARELFSRSARAVALVSPFSVQACAGEP